MNRRRFCTVLAATVIGTRSLFAEEPATPATEAPPDFDFMSLLTKTTGGKQFWADVWFFRDYRIQCHALTNHYRLLDGNNHRVLSGTFDLCQQKLEEIREQQKLAPMEGKA